MVGNKSDGRDEDGPVPITVQRVDRLLHSRPQPFVSGSALTLIRKSRGHLTQMFAHRRHRATNLLRVRVLHLKNPFGQAMSGKEDLNMRTNVDRALIQGRDNVFSDCLGETRMAMPTLNETDRKIAA